jgi:hypothetical protein
MDNLNRVWLSLVLVSLFTNYLVFQSFDFERTRWRFFQKCVLCTKLDIYVFQVEGLFSKLKQVSSSYQRSILFPNRPSIYDSLVFYIIHSLFCSKKRFTLARINVLYSEVYFYWLHQNMFYICCKKGGGVPVLQQKQINNTQSLLPPTTLQRDQALYRENMY